jgi:4-carboxymuconolactone decarboxylase
MPAKPAAKPRRKTIPRAAARNMAPSRLPSIPDEKLTPEQRALIDAIQSGPRGKSTEIRGPFAVFLHSPPYGQLAQKLGGFCRLESRVPARLSEFAILATAQLWRSQYEWHAHAGHAERAGVSTQTLRELQRGLAPKSAAKDERAIYDFIHELYRTKRVSDRTYKRLHAVMGDAGMVELVGILGYYALVAMSLNVFRMPPPPSAPLPFAEPKGS